MSLEQFLNRYPEFKNTDPALVSQVLIESQNEMSKKFWGDLFNAALYALSAHKLAISPMGEPCRLDGSIDKTIYQVEYDRLAKSAFLGAQVI